MTEEEFDKIQLAVIFQIRRQQLIDLGLQDLAKEFEDRINEIKNSSCGIKSSQ